MSTIHLPVFQHFDCHSCGYCCRNLVVNVTDAERKKIFDAGWASRIADQPLFISYRFRGRRLHRLAQRPDGRCIFLGDDERCRLHAETGMATKPLPCRLYPFVATPGAGSVRIDVRADCPSVAANNGRSLSVYQSEINKLVDEIGTAPMAHVPSWPGVGALTVAEFKSVVAAFQSCLRTGTLNLRTRLAAACHLLDLLYQVQLRKVRGPHFVELMDLLAASAIAEAGDASRSRLRDDSIQSSESPTTSPRAIRLFRQWLFLHTIADDPQQLTAGFLRKMKQSWMRYGQARQFARGAGPIPKIAADWPATDFENVLQIQAAPDDALEPVCRSLLVKLDAHAFAGPGYYGCDVIRGLTALCLLPSVIGWFARLEAVIANHTVLTHEDILAGVRRAYHTYGVSPVFAQISERLRLRALARDKIAGLLLKIYCP